MSSSAKNISVICKVGNVTIPVNSISFRHVINSLPTVEFTTQLSNRAAGTSINLQQFQALNIIVQQRFYNNFSLVPDTSIEVTDGDGNTITFIGFLMQPRFRLANGQLNLVFSAVHVGAAFQAFNGSAYFITPYYGAATYESYFNGFSNYPKSAILLSQLEDLPPINASVQTWSDFMDANGNYENLFVTGQKSAPVTNSISQHIWTVISNLHAVIVEDAARNPADVQNIMNITVLNANTAVLPYVRNFLMGSFLTTVIAGLSRFGTSGAGDDPDTQPLHETIFKILTESPNFLATILNYIPPFLFQLNATWDGCLAFEPNQFIQSPNGRLIQAPISDILFSLAGSHELPLAQVIVQSQQQEYYTFGGNLSTNQTSVETAESDLNIESDVTPQNSNLPRLFNTLTYGGDTLRFLTRYPEVPVVTAGRYMTVTAPSWTRPTSYTGADITDLEAPSSTPLNRFVNAVAVYTRQQQTKFTNQQSTRAPVLDYLARLTYESSVLEKTNAFLTIPLNLLVQVGRTYDIQSMEGDSMYSGFLNAVTHTITLEEQGGTATTTLDFSHIIVTGAALKGINAPVPESPFDGSPNGNISSPGIAGLV